jgi:hypothetical protein
VARHSPRRRSRSAKRRAPRSATSSVNGVVAGPQQVIVDRGEGDLLHAAALLRGLSAQGVGLLVAETQRHRQAVMTLF